MDLKPYYSDDYVTIYHADSLKHPELWTHADVMISDPPYGIRFERLGSGGKSGHIGQTDFIEGDKDVVARDTAIKLMDGKPYILFGSWKQSHPEGIRSRIVWWKQGGGMNFTRGTVMCVDEEIYLKGDGFMQTQPACPSVIATGESRAAYSSGIGHPNAKPLELMERLIKFTSSDWLIADPFMGSGSTLVAAKSLHRKAVGVEVKEEYCNVAARRCSQDFLF